MRIEGVNLPKDKRILIGLTYVFGIGRSLAADVLKAAKIDHDTKVQDLTPEQESKIRDQLADLTLEGDLKRKVSSDIKRIQEIGTYRGFRHMRNLPVRGQRTKTNSRTKRGKRKTAGSGKLKITKK